MMNRRGASQKASQKLEIIIAVGRSILVSIALKKPYDHYEA